LNSKAIISEAFLAHASESFLADEQRFAFIEACRRPLRKSIRVNTLKVSVEEFGLKAQQLGLELSPIPWCKEGFWVNHDDLKFNMPTKTDISLGNLASHMQGLFYIQEASSMLPPQALFDGSEKHGALKVLDLAAAPGSKTTQMAALMDNRGLLLANEISASRVKSLHANIVRCGVANTCLTQFDGRKLGDRLANQFDLVLLDAPCGGEGTIRKDSKALENWQLSKVKEISELQKQLILTAYQCLKPGGKLVYSTCTLSPEENQHVAQHLLSQTNADVHNLADLFEGASRATTSEGFLHIQPQIFDSEGFFVSAFSKTKQKTEKVVYSEIQNNSKSKPSKADRKRYKNGQGGNSWKPSFSLLEKNSKAKLLDYFASHFGLLSADFSGELQQKDKVIWLFPNGASQLIHSVKLNRAGIKVAEIFPNKIRTHHEFIIAFANHMSSQLIELSSQQAEAFYQGKSLELSMEQLSLAGLKQGEVVLTYEGGVLGLASLAKGKLKNQLPRDLVKDGLKLA
jgi:16S rRNA (cytosine1407-C5)-methyltransferase